MRMKTKINLNSKKSFESVINSIFNSLSSNLSDSSVVVKEQPRRGCLCKAVINVFNTADIRRQDEETKEYHALLSRGYSKEMLEKPFTATPSIKYAFYADSTDPNKLESVAIYGKNVMRQYLMISTSRSLYGHAVKSYNGELGLSPFLDVKYDA